MELTIHIGPHKTGTTAVQAAFSRHAAQLRRMGVLYPKTHWRQQAHHRLAFALKGKSIPGGDTPELEVELARLCQAIDNAQADKVLISSEEFFTCPPGALERLQSTLAVSVRVVCFLRRPDTFLISCYNQKVKQPGNGFAAPITRFVTDPLRIAPEIDYLTAVGTWADVFGDEAMRVECYEDASPLARLWQMLELAPDALPPDAVLNESVPGVVVDIMRHAKAYGLSDAKQRKLLARARQVYDGYPPFFVADEDRASIIAAMEPDLDRLFARFGRDNPYTVARFTPVPHPRGHNLIMQDVMCLLDGHL